jgi:hypothetical protein
MTDVKTILDTLGGVAENKIRRKEVKWMDEWE